MNKHFPPARLLLLMVWGVFAVLAYRCIAIGLHEVDFWWHLAIGRLMVETHHFFNQDLFSSTLFGKPWMNFEWLSEIFIYAVWKLGGFKGLYTAKILFCLSAMFFLTFAVFKAGARSFWLFLLTAWGFLVVLFRLLEKPELVTLNFLPIFVLACTQARVFSARQRTFLSWFLFAVMIVWVNAHAGFVYGIALVALLCVGARWAGERQAYIGFLDRLLTLCLVAILLNPRGPALMTVFVDHLLAGPVRISSDYIRTPFDGLRAPFWLLFVTTWAVLVRSPRRLLGPAAAVFSLWGVVYMRNMVLLPFVALPLIAEALPPVPSIVVLAASVLILIPVQRLSNHIHRTMPAPVVTTVVPEGACRFVEATGVEGTLFNEADFGGYLLWRWSGERKIFMDGRYIFAELMAEVDNLWKGFKGPGDQPYVSFFKAHEVDYAIVGYSPAAQAIFSNGGAPFPFNIRNVMFPRSDWALVYWDEAAMVFVKRLPKFQKLIKQYEYKSVWPYNRAQMEYLIQTKAVSATDVDKELKRAAALRQSFEKTLKST